PAMNRLYSHLLLALVALAFAAAPDTARAQTPENPPTVEDSPSRAARFSAGLQSSWPTYGLSLQYHLNEKLTAEGVADFMGNLTNVGGRVLYRYRRDGDYDLYAYGGGGVWHYSFLGVGESVPGASVGVGAEAFLEQLLGAPGEPF